MSINMLGRMADAEKLSIPQLQQVIQNGTLPAYIGVPLLQEKLQMQKQAQAPQAQPQPPVAQQVMAEAAQATAPQAPQQMPPQGIAQGTVSNGIDHLQTNLPTKDMAQGGIIAFDEGGEVQHFANKGQVRFTGANQADTEGYIVDGNYPGSPYDQSIFGYGPRAMGALVSDVIGLPGKLAYAPYDEKTGLQHRYEKEGFFPSVSGFEQNEIERIKSGNKKTKDIVTNAKANDAKKAVVQEAKINGVANPQIRPASADAAGISSLASNFAGAGKGNPLLTALDNQGVPDKVKDGAPSADALDNLALRLTKGSRGAGSGNGPVSWTDMTSNSAEIDALKKPDRTIEDFMADKKTRMGENKGLTEREARLRKMEEETNTMEEKSPWLALMKAGIGTMKGTSQHALVNIGGGAEEGLNDYIKAQDKIATKKEKIYDAQTNLADARRNEELAIINYGENSKQALDAHNNTISLQKIADKTATERLNKEGALRASTANAEIASAESRTAMSAGVQLAIAKQDNNMKQYIADMTHRDALTTKMASQYIAASNAASTRLTGLLGNKGVDPMGMGAVKSVAEGNALYLQLLKEEQISAGLPVLLPPSASTGAPTAGTTVYNPNTKIFDYVQSKG